MVYLIIKLLIFLTFIFITTVRGIIETPCSSNIQKCGYEIQDLERQIIEIKTKTFKKCIKKLK